MFQTKNKNVGALRGVAIIPLTILVLTACSDSTDQVIVETINERPTEPPKLNSATSFDGPLVKAGQVLVSRFIKNGIYSAAFDYDNSNNSNRDGFPVAAASEDSASSNAGFSSTNTQESGVDEADRIEYDGEILYLAAHQQWLQEGVSQSKVRVLERQNDFSLNSVAELPL